ncbi:MAG: HlyC/CorC family transporter [Halothiobacillaceae bacterium]|nr:MAG: HlyC/CorC family transporter [Halothiobacillaceae bacterium]
MDSTGLSLLVIVLLLVANGFFVAAEFALVKVRGMRIESLAETGRPSARLTLRIKRNLEAYLAACQLGITMASLGLGWVGEPAVAALLEPLFHAMGLSEAMLHTLSFVIGFIIFSSLHIVIGEQVPKTYAIRKPEPVSLWVAYPLHAFYLLAWPLTMALNWASRRILRAMKVAEAGHEEIFSGEELHEMIGASRVHGQIEHKQADMLQNLFAFDQRIVRDIMVPRSAVDRLDLDDASDENVRIMKETGHSRFPVIEGGDDHPVGILLIKDIYTAVLEGQAAPWTRLREFTRNTLMVPDTITIGRLFEQMKAGRAHMALVLNEYGAFAGLVTMEDLIEEIVGEIADELDEITEQQSHIQSVEDGVWEADGLTPLHDLERALDISVDAGPNASTLSGLIMSLLGRLPELGDVIDYKGYRFEVTRMEGRRADAVHIQAIASDERADDTADHSL